MGRMSELTAYRHPEIQNQIPWKKVLAILAIPVLAVGLRSCALDTQDTKEKSVSDVKPISTETIHFSRVCFVPGKTSIAAKNSSGQDLYLVVRTPTDPDSDIRIQIEPGQLSTSALGSFIDVSEGVLVDAFPASAYDEVNGITGKPIASFPVAPEQIDPCKPLPPLHQDVQ